MNSRFWLGGMSLETKELPLDFKLPKDGGAIVLRQKTEAAILTKLKIDDFTEIFIYWSPGFKDNRVEILPLPQECILFVGAGTISAQIDLNNSRVIRVREVDSVDGFIQHPNCVIEQCYGGCTAFSLTGDIINYHDLGMMWESQYEDGYYCTVCHDNGKRRLVKIDN